MMRRACAVAAIALLIGVVGCGDDEESASSGGSTSGAGEEVQLKYSTTLPDTSSLEAGPAWWMEKVTADSGDSVTFEPFYAGALLQGPDTLKGLSDGRADLALVAATYSPADFPLFLASSLPFLTRNPEAATRALGSLYENNAAFKAEFDKVGVVPLFFIPVSSSIVGTKEPLESVADFDGLRIRALGYSADALKQVGADPVTILPQELYESLERGVIDAFAGVLLDTIPALGLEDVTNHLTDPGLGIYSGQFLGISKRRWDELSDEQRTVMTDAAQEAIGEANQALVDAEAKACTDLKAGGAELSAWDDAQVAEWSDAVQEKIEGLWRSQAIDAGISESDVDGVLSDFKDAIAESSTEGAEACVAG